ncbi:MAG: anthrone oxygenase family protein [Cumulibacter sp.]
MVVFFGAPATAIIGAIAHVGADIPHSSGWVIAGGILSALTFLITAMANVPLNRGLDLADVDTDVQQHAACEGFEARWNRWNLARTLTSVLCILSLAMAITAH